MTIKEIIDTVETRHAPLANQESYDNSGLQTGVFCNGRTIGNTQVNGILICLDITEDVVDEAIAEGFNLILSHHPLLFHPLRRICGESMEERCIIKAIRHGISIYSAHTSLDNSKGGVNHMIAGMLGLERTEWLESKGPDCGSGLTGYLPAPMTEEDFLRFVRDVFKTDCLMHNRTHGRTISKVALCGGSGAFLLDRAIEAGADTFITGEISYHAYFGHDRHIVTGNTRDILLVETGHYQSERFTIDLLENIVRKEFPEVAVKRTRHDTNPVFCLRQNLK